MGRWRARAGLALMAYGAGVLSTIYWLAPLPDDERVAALDREALERAVNRDRLVKAVNKSLHECVDFSVDMGKDAANRMGKTLRDKWDQTKASENEGS